MNNPFEIKRVCEGKMKVLKNGAYVVEVCEFCGHTSNTLVPVGGETKCPGCNMVYANYEMEWTDYSPLGDGRTVIQECINGRVVNEVIVDEDGYPSINQSKLVEV